MQTPTVAVRVALHISDGGTVLFVLLLLLTSWRPSCQPLYTRSHTQKPCARLAQGNEIKKILVALQPPQRPRGWLFPCCCCCVANGELVPTERAPNVHTGTRKCTAVACLDEEACGVSSA